MRRERSMEPDYFEALYRENPDPWGFETSPYEAAKYAETLGALPANHFNRVLEVGCANGVLTERLARYCTDLFAVDVSPTALAAAQRRCSSLSNVHFALRRLPTDAPEGPFDLILLSEIVYYWDSADLIELARWLIEVVPSGGHILLVHWTGDTDYPKSGDDAVTELRALLGKAVTVDRAEPRDAYRIDMWRRG